MTHLFRSESSNPLTNSQRNLMGRTHHVDPDTLRFHKSRVLSARHTDGGLLFAIVTSDTLDPQNSKRGFRYVIFDVFGTVLSRVSLEDAWRNRAKCEKAMWVALDVIDAKAHTLDAIEKARASYLSDLARFEQTVLTINAEKAA